MLRNGRLERGRRLDDASIMSQMGEDKEITDLLALGLDHPQAIGRLVPRVYGELRRMASRHLAKERRDHTWQTTELVHEVFLKLVGRSDLRLEDRLHFFSLAAILMRRVLVDYARRAKADKRIDRSRIVVIEELEGQEPASRVAAGRGPDLDILALDRALTRLSELDQERAKVVELRYFGGLTLPETAEALGVSEATVSRRWRAARLWLRREIRRQGAG